MNAPYGISLRYHLRGFSRYDLMELSTILCRIDWKGGNQQGDICYREGSTPVEWAAHYTRVRFHEAGADIGEKDGFRSGTI